MDWQEALGALKPAMFGLAGAAIFLMLFSAFLAAHPI
jgi:hypothetical protein